MKIVVRRHDRPFAIFRALAVAQALARIPGAEVFLECLESWKSVLELTPAIKWKNPHHPFAVHQRGEAGTRDFRKGGALYDHVIDLDGDGPFEAKWAHFGLQWWDWVLSEMAEDILLWDPTLRAAFDENFEAWPAIEVPLAATSAGRPRPLNYVLVDALSDEISPFGVNAKLLEDRIRQECPSSEIVWSARHPQANFGAGRVRLVAGSYRELAQQIAAAAAVYAVNGMVFALAMAKHGAAPLQAKTVFLRPAPELASDPFGKIRRLFEPRLPAGVRALEFRWAKKIEVDPRNQKRTEVDDRTQVAALEDLTPAPAN